MNKQAGAELCQAQEKLGLTNLALPCKLWSSSIENNKKNYGHLPLTKNGDHLVVANI